MTFALGILVGILWAYAPIVLVFALISWRDRKERRAAIDDILSRAAVLHD